MFIAHSLTTDNPFITRSIFTDRNFVLGLIFMFLLGVLVLSMNVIMPLFPQNSRGLPILTAALIMVPRGLGTMFDLVFAGRAASVIDPRVVISVLSRSQATTHAYLAERTSPYAEAMREPWLPSQRDIFTNDRLMALQAEVSHQALAIGFLKDFNLIFYGAVISIPLVMLMVCSNTARAATG